MSTPALTPVSGSEKDVEARYGIKAGTLRAWRSRVEGPPYVKAGTLVIYRFADIEAYLDENTVTPGTT